MLEPDHRAVLLDQLRPPPGYRLDAAIATTFTLDLASAVVPPLAFASFEIRGTPDPIAALEAVRSCTDRVDLFCQAGQVRVPTTGSDLMAFLEPMVHPVRRPRSGYLFHPKVWFLRYVADGEPDRFRLLCSTRNLTDSQAWDAVVVLEGTRGTRVDSRNRPLARFIRYLPDRAVTALPPERLGRIESLAHDAERMEWERPDGVLDVAFHAFGIPRTTAEPDFGGYRHLVISPFMNEAGLALVTAGSKEVTVVSRAEALDALGEEALRGMEVHTLDPLAVLRNFGEAVAEADASGGDLTAAGAAPSPAPASEVDSLSGLHAKITVVERGHRAHVFIGSPNATGAAYGGNVEFAVELTGTKKHLGIDTFLGGKGSLADLLESYQPGPAVADTEADRLRELTNHLRALAEVALTLRVQHGPADEDTFALTLASSRDLPKGTGATITAELLTRPGLALPLAPGRPAGARFERVPLPDITPFVVLRLTDAPPAGEPLTVSGVVCAAILGDPPSRLDAVLARQVDTTEKFIRFLTLLLRLGEGDIGNVLALADGADAASAGQSWQTGSGPGIFEAVVNALASNPASLHQFDALVRRLESTEAGQAIIPAGFDRLWSTVREAMELIR